LSAEPEIRRPNRAHGAIDRLPDEIQLQIKDWYFDKLTLDDITQQLNERLEAEGIEQTINRNQVWRWMQRQRQDLERIERARTKAEVLTKHLVGDSKDVGEAAEGLCKAILLEALADADTLKATEILDVARIANSLGRLATGKVARERWEMEKRKKIEAAVQQLKEDVRALLANEPELTTKLFDVIDRAASEMTEQS
jgi:hypothetical protein